MNARDDTRALLADGGRRAILAIRQDIALTQVRVGDQASLFVYRNGCRVWQYDWRLN